MKPNTRLKANRDASNILLKQANGDAMAVTCCVPPRPQPLRQSSLSPLKGHVTELRGQGQTLEQIADWIESIAGHRPHRSTVLRLLRTKAPRSAAIQVARATKRHRIAFDGHQVDVVEQHGLLSATQEADIARKAFAIVRDLTRYVPKARQERRFPFRSVGTREAMESALRCFGRFLEASKLGNLSAVPVGACRLYLEARAAIGIGRDQLKKDRRALACAYGERLGSVRAQPREPRRDRAVSPAQLAAISAAQTARNRYSSELAYVGGLRAFELLTVARLQDQPPDNREWHELLHAGLTGGQLYTCKGKGGLVRIFFTTDSLAAILETKRRAKPIFIQEGKRRVLSHYDIAGGSAWASSFRKAALRVFRASPGAHGTRHGYVLNRRRSLAALGLAVEEIESILAQELGHFRRDVVSEFYDHDWWDPGGGKRSVVRAVRTVSPESFKAAGPTSGAQRNGDGTRALSAQL